MKDRPIAAKIRNARLVVILLTLGGMAAIVVATIFLFIPAFRADVKLSSQITMAHAELDAQYANRKNLLSSLDKADQARADIRLLSAQFVQPGHELDLITALENLATADEVEERLTLRPNDDAKAAAELNEYYELTVNGDYPKVMRMLVDVERLPTLMVVESGSVRPGPGPNPGDPPFLSVVLRGTLANPPNGL